MAVSPVPEDLNSVTPSLMCTPWADAIEFYSEAFGAEEIGPRMTGPDGSVGHAEIRIGDIDHARRRGARWADPVTENTG